MSSLQVNVQYPDGRVEDHDTELDTIRIGSDAHCEIRLPQEESAGEAVVVTLRDGVLSARASATDPAPKLDGVPLKDAPLGPGSTIEIGLIRIGITAPPAEGDAPGPAKRALKVSPLTAVAGALAIPAAIFIVLSSGPGPDTRAPAEVPPLWPADAATGCADLEKDQAVAAAAEKQAAAEDKRERSPFHIQDGVRAVPLFEAAAACYSLGGDAARAEEMTRAASRLRTDLTDQYKAHRVRLEHAMRVGDPKAALRQIKVLLAMLEGQRGPYVVWLSNRDRQLQIKLGKGKAR